MTKIVARLEAKNLIDCGVIFGKFRPAAKLWWVDEAIEEGQEMRLKLSCYSTTRNSRRENVILDASKNSSEVKFDTKRRILTWKDRGRTINLILKKPRKKRTQKSFAA